MSFVDKCFKRPRNYFRLYRKEQLEIDKELGIQDWDGEFTFEELVRFDHYFDLWLDTRCYSLEGLKYIECKTLPDGTVKWYSKILGNEQPTPCSHPACYKPNH